MFSPFPLWVLIPRINVFKLKGGKILTSASIRFSLTTKKNLKRNKIVDLIFTYSIGLRKKQLKFKRIIVGCYFPIKWTV